MDYKYLDYTLVPFGFILMVSYHAYFFWKVRRHPLKTVVGVNHRNRRAWVRSVMRDEVKYGVLAVQTTRNSIMASTLLASTSISLAAIVASFISSTTSSSLNNVLENLVFLGSTSRELLTVKLFCILVCFLLSFLCFVQAIRYTNHVNFIITIPMGPEAPGLNSEYVSSVLARGNNFYTAGSRGYYFAFPFILWVFGPVFMFVFCIILLPVLFIVDFINKADEISSSLL